MEQQIQSFINQNNNKFIKVLPNNLPPQCFDLVVKWTDTLGIPHAPGNPSPFPVVNAYEIYTKFGDFQAKYFDRIFNSPDAVAQAGDIIVWSGQYNRGVGHTAVCKKADLYSLECFSQNDPTGKPSIVRTYNYTNILGWLRPKYSTIEQREAKAIEILKSNDNDFDKVFKLKQVYRLG